MLTHRAACLDPDGRWTTFHFRSTGIEEVLAEAAEVAGGKDVRVGGGIGTARAFLLASLVDHLHLMIASIALGNGTRLWDGLDGLEQTHTVDWRVTGQGEPGMGQPAWGRHRSTA